MMIFPLIKICGAKNEIAIKLVYVSCKWMWRGVWWGATSKKKIEYGEKHDGDHEIATKCNACVLLAIINSVFYYSSFAERTDITNCNNVYCVWVRASVRAWVWQTHQNVEEEKVYPYGNFDLYNNGCWCCGYYFYGEHLFSIQMIIMLITNKMRKCLLNINPNASEIMRFVQQAVSTQNHAIHLIHSFRNIGQDIYGRKIFHGEKFVNFGRQNDYFFFWKIESSCLIYSTWTDIKYQIGCSVKSEKSG